LLSASAGCAKNAARTRRRGLTALQLGQDHRYVASLDRPDLLVTDHALAIDDEAFRHTRRAERNLDVALRIASDPLVGVAVAREEIDEIVGTVANGDPYDMHAVIL
jgi:hypothetical protein